ncbi:MAG: 2-dehydropantoate 2-reductase [Solirubrobacteraceae bacterium]|jgi:2-dehydropantoate 2-reductase
MKIAILGPGGVGGLLAGVLDRAGNEVIVVAREDTAELIAERGVDVRSVIFGDFIAHPRVVAELQEPVDALIVATKAAGLEPALERIRVEPTVVLPLLNGLDHIAVLRRRFAASSVLAGSIRVEADRPQPGVVVHTSPFLLVSMASGEPGESGDRSVDDTSVADRMGVMDAMQALADTLSEAGVPTKVLDSEAQVMWSKLVRLNALACTTSAYDELLGEIRSTPALRADLVGAIEEACAVGKAEGAHDVDPAIAIDELERAHDTLGSSMQRDIAAGREPELDAIPGSVLRAGARHGIACPTIERLVAMIAVRAGVPGPLLP